LTAAHFIREEKGGYLDAAIPVLTGMRRSNLLLPLWAARHKKGE
jgi:hypothetical protein